MGNVDRIKAGGVTGRTVATGAKVLVVGAVGCYQAAVGVMAGCTTGVCICTRLATVSQQSIVVTGCTAGPACAGTNYGHQATVIRDR